MGHAHGHGEADRKLLAAAAVLLVVFMLVEVAVADAVGSLVLLADAGHMLVDVLALVMAIGASAVAARPAGGRWTFGLARAEVLSAAVNGVTLLVVSAVILIEAIRRLVHPPHVTGTPLVVVASVGLGVNVVAAALITRADRSSLNVAGAFAHVLTDAYAFAATIAAGVVVLATDFHRADPVASLVVVALMLRAAWRLLRESGHVLLEAAPEHVDLSDLREHLLGTTHVIDVHDLHVWTSGSRLPSVSAHVVVADSCFSDGLAPRLLDELQECLVGHFDVEHSTFQLEPASHTQHEAGAHH